MKKSGWAVAAGACASAAIILGLLAAFAGMLLSVTWIGYLSGIFMLACAVSLYMQNKQAKTEKSLLHQIQQEKMLVTKDWREAENSFSSIFETSTTGLAVINLDGRLLKVNKALCQLLGYTEPEMLNMNYYYLVHSNDLNNLQIYIQQLINKTLPSYQSEQQWFRKNGETIWIMSTLTLVRDDEKNPVRFIVQIQNITTQKKAEERLRHMAYHDPLTGLANRNKLEQFINHILATARRHQQGFALMFLDLDRFKNINDTIGHESGDLLLQVVAERLLGAVRNTDMVARFGGDEFVILITDVKKTESAAVIAQKILDSVLKVIVIKGQEIYLTTSIGISLYPYDGQNLQSLMKNADLALYRSKDSGGNNYQFYTNEMTIRAKEKMALQNALAHALVKEEFELNYQPKMDIKSRKITGIEAFLRWRNPDYGNISTDEIISIAEETGLIIPVSEWILKTACQQLRYWHDMGFSSLSMSINSSLRQFKQANFIDDVMQMLTKYGLSPALLEIEVTESIIMQDPENTLRVLYALKDIGVTISVDDFGTGYWSLSNLRRLCVDKVKIDKTFVRQVTHDETSAAITCAIIAMTAKLGIRSVAEGVETREQYDFLAREGCDEIQGYYLTQPLSSEAMTHFLKHPIPDAEVIVSKELTTS